MIDKSVVSIIMHMLYDLRAQTDLQLYLLLYR